MRRSPDAVLFRDRADAGRQLAARVRDLRLADPVVLALPRGGVPVGAEVARALGTTVEVFVARKVGAPDQPEYGIGAVAEGEGHVANRRVLPALGLTDEDFTALAERERAEVDRRVERYRGGRPLPKVTGRDVVLVDDGLATGVTAEASLRSLRALAPRWLVLAVPVGVPETADRLRPLADEVVCIHTPWVFDAVGQFYEDFRQLTDNDVVRFLGAPG